MGLSDTLSKGKEQNKDDLPTITGVIPGTVVNTYDPQDLGRIKVLIPRISMEFTTNYARVATPQSGNRSGLYCRPEVGDEVLVAFENGDITLPYVIGSLWNARMPSPVPAYDGKIIEIRARSMETPPPPKGPTGPSAWAEDLGLEGTEEGTEASLEAEEEEESAEEAPGAESPAEGEADQEEELASEETETAAESSGGTGHTIRLNANTGESRIEIIDESGGNRIVIDTQTNTILINSNMNIEMNAQEAIILNAPTIALNATADVNINSEASIMLSTAAVTADAEEGINLVAGTEISAEAGGDVSISAAGGVEMEAGGEMNLSAGGALNAEAGGEMDLSAGGAWNAEAGGEAGLSAGGIVEIEAAADVSIMGALITLNL